MCKFRDFTLKKASPIYGITECRVQQLTKICRDTGEVPALNLNRRPNAHLSDEPIETFLKWYTNRIHSTQIISTVRHHKRHFCEGSRQKRFFAGS